MGIHLKNVGSSLEKVGKELGGELEKAGKSVGTAVEELVTGKAGQAGTDAKNAIQDVGDGFYDAGAESIGVGELLGLNYGVTAYQAKVDGNLTRGSRLSDAGIAQLHNQGYKSVVNLCLENDDDTPRAEALGMNALHVPVLDNSAPTEAQVKQFLDFVTDPKNQPAYVHCEAGKGRTGAFSAAYRMAVDGWSADAAITEGKQFGLQLPNQIAFLQRLGQDLQAGKLPGYPKA